MRPLADRRTERDLDCVGMDARIDSLLPLWQSTAAPLPENAAIHGEHRALFDASPIDTIVIGAGVTGLFGMELGRPERALLYCSDEPVPAVLGPGNPPFRSRRQRAYAVTVHEIEVF